MLVLIVLGLSALLADLIIRKFVKPGKAQQIVSAITTILLFTAVLKKIYLIKRPTYAHFYRLSAYVSIMMNGTSAPNP